MIGRHEKPAPDKLAYTVREAAIALNVGRSTVYELMNTGDLPSFTIRTRRLIAVVDIEDYIESRRTTSWEVA